MAVPLALGLWKRQRGGLSQVRRHRSEPLRCLRAVFQHHRGRFPVPKVAAEALQREGVVGRRVRGSYGIGVEIENENENEIKIEIENGIGNKNHSYDHNNHYPANLTANRKENISNISNISMSASVDCW
mmetsp:Transcript_20469/g.48020  ORF Transcript_20469/g.48020 Transcript_20469/m.48020 type:complete len:129 (-) Transcript_20469:24-410(-)